MNIIVKKITDKILHVEFENQLELAETFLRFEEFYESPEFKGKVFTLNEYKKWYIKQKGTFSYYDDWPAFNLPPRILKPFIEGKFNPLSEKEKIFISLVKNYEDYYIIGTFEEGHPSLFKHELTHAMFYTIPEYKRDVLNILDNYNTKFIQKELMDMAGYCEEVMLDEVNAWVLFPEPDELKSEVPLGLKEKLKKVFDKYQIINS